MKLFTKEEQLKGAHTPSIYRSMSNVLKKRKKCNPKCFFFETCPFASISISNPEKKCMMRAFPEKVRARFYKMFMGNEEDLISEIKTAVYHYGLSVDATTSLREKKDYIDILLKLHKAIYGDKTQVIDREPLKITLTQISTGSEKPMIDITPAPIQIEEKVKYPESKKSQAYREKIMKECEPIAAIETDPESLFHSDKLDGILRKSESRDEERV